MNGHTAHSGPAGALLHEAHGEADKLQQLAELHCKSGLRDESVSIVREARETLRLIEDKAHQGSAVPDAVARAAHKALGAVQVLHGKVFTASRDEGKKGVMGMLRMVSQPHKKMFKDAREALASARSALTEPPERLPSDVLEGAPSEAASDAPPLRPPPAEGSLHLTWERGVRVAGVCLAPGMLTVALNKKMEFYHDLNPAHRHEVNGGKDPLWSVATALLYDEQTGCTWTGHANGRVLWHCPGQWASGSFPPAGGAFGVAVRSLALGGRNDVWAGDDAGVIRVLTLDPVTQQLTCRIQLVPPAAQHALRAPVALPPQQAGPHWGAAPHAHAAAAAARGGAPVLALLGRGPVCFSSGGDRPCSITVWDSGKYSPLELATCDSYGAVRSFALVPWDGGAGEEGGGGPATAGPYGGAQAPAGQAAPRATVPASCLAAGAARAGGAATAAAAADFHTWRLLSGQEHGQVLLWQMRGKGRTAAHVRLLQLLAVIGDPRPQWGAVQHMAVFPGLGMLVLSCAPGSLLTLPMPTATNGALPMAPGGGYGAAAGGLPHALPQQGMGVAPAGLHCWRPPVAQIKAHKSGIVSASQLGELLVTASATGAKSWTAERLKLEAQGQNVMFSRVDSLADSNNSSAGGNAAAAGAAAAAAATGWADGAEEGSALPPPAPAAAALGAAGLPPPPTPPPEQPRRSQPLPAACHIGNPMSRSSVASRGIAVDASGTVVMRQPGVPPGWHQPEGIVVRPGGQLPPISAVGEHYHHHPHGVHAGSSSLPRGAGSGGSTERGEGSGSLDPANSVPPDLRLNVHHVICKSELVLREVIGSGAEGKVYRGMWTNIDIAAKEYLPVDEGDGCSSKTGEAPSEAAMEHARHALLREVSLLINLNHPNLVRFCGVCLDPPLVVMEYYKHGSVYTMLEKARRQANATAAMTAQQAASKAATKYMAYFTWDRRLEMLHDVAAGMMYLHKRHYVHGDLRSTNLFMGSDGRVKIGDFGFTKRLSSTHASLRVNRITHPRWVAPELMMHNRLSIACDVYSFGIIMYEMLTWQLPFKNLRKEQVVLAVVMHRGRPEIPTDEELPPGSSSSICLGNYKKLMQQCWDQDPEKRPPFEAIAARLKAMIRWRMVIRQNRVLSNAARALRQSRDPQRLAEKAAASALADAASTRAAEAPALGQAAEPPALAPEAPAAPAEGGSAAAGHSAPGGDGGRAAPARHEAPAPPREALLPARAPSAAPDDHEDDLPLPEHPITPIPEGPDLPEAMEAGPFAAGADAPGAAASAAAGAAALPAAPGRGPGDEPVVFVAPGGSGDVQLTGLPGGRVLVIGSDVPSSPCSLATLSTRNSVEGGAAASTASCGAPSAAEHVPGSAAASEPPPQAHERPPSAGAARSAPHFASASSAGRGSLGTPPPAAPPVGEQRPSSADQPTPGAGAAAAAAAAAAAGGVAVAAAAAAASAPCGSDAAGGVLSAEELLSRGGGGGDAHKVETWLEAQGSQDGGGAAQGQQQRRQVERAPDSAQAAARRSLEALQQQQQQQQQFAAQAAPAAHAAAASRPPEEHPDRQQQQQQQRQLEQQQQQPGEPLDVYQAQDSPFFLLPQGPCSSSSVDVRGLFAGGGFAAAASGAAASLGTQLPGFLNPSLLDDSCLPPEGNGPGLASATTIVYSENTTPVDAAISSSVSGGALPSLDAEAGVAVAAGEPASVCPLSVDASPFALNSPFAGGVPDDVSSVAAAPPPPPASLGPGPFADIMSAGPFGGQGAGPFGAQAGAPDAGAFGGAAAAAPLAAAATASAGAEPPPPGYPTVLVARAASPAVAAHGGATVPREASPVPVGSPQHRTPYPAVCAGGDRVDVTANWLQNAFGVGAAAAGAAAAAAAQQQQGGDQQQLQPQQQQDMASPAANAGAADPAGAAAAAAAAAGGPVNPALSKQYPRRLINPGDLNKRLGPHKGSEDIVEEARKELAAFTKRGPGERSARQRSSNAGDAASQQSADLSRVSPTGGGAGADGGKPSSPPVNAGWVPQAMPGVGVVPAQGYPAAAAYQLSRNGSGYDQLAMLAAAGDPAAAAALGLMSAGGAGGAAGSAAAAAPTFPTPQPGERVKVVNRPAAYGAASLDGGTPLGAAFLGAGAAATANSAAIQNWVVAVRSGSGFPSAPLPGQVDALAAQQQLQQQQQQLSVQPQASLQPVPGIFGIAPPVMPPGMSGMYAVPDLAAAQAAMLADGTLPAGGGASPRGPDPRWVQQALLGVGADSAATPGQDAAASDPQQQQQQQMAWGMPSQQQLQQQQQLLQLQQQLLFAQQQQMLQQHMYGVPMPGQQPMQLLQHLQQQQQAQQLMHQATQQQQQHHQQQQQRMPNPGPGV